MPGNSSARLPFADTIAAVDPTKLLAPLPPALELRWDLIVPAAAAVQGFGPTALVSCCGGADGLDFWCHNLGRFSKDCESMEKKHDSLPEMLMWVKDSAIAFRSSFENDPSFASQVQMQVLRARRCLFLKRGHHSCVAQEYPYQKRRRRLPSPHKTSYLFAKPSEKFSRWELKYDERNNFSKRKSKRLLGMLDIASLPRKHIPVGSSFQAEVPEFSCRPDGSCSRSDEEKWFGNNVWPLVEGDCSNLNLQMIGKGRPNSCECFSPGSANCSRLHIQSSKLRLEVELGPAFSAWLFCEMGEGVSASWLPDEERRFTDIVRQTPVLEQKSFMETFLAEFPSKTRKDVIRYYYNVFLPRRIGCETCFGDEVNDSDDDFYVNLACKLGEKMESNSYRRLHWLDSHHLRVHNDA